MFVSARFAEIKKAFDVFDIEEDGQIRTEELENALRIAKMNPTPSDIQQIKESLGNPGKPYAMLGQFRIAARSLCLNTCHV